MSAPLTGEDLAEIGTALASEHCLEPTAEERAAFVSDWERLREENVAQLVEIRRLEVVAIERATEIHRLKKSVVDLESRLAAVVERHT